MVTETTQDNKVDKVLALEKIEKIKDVSKDIRDIHDKTIAHIYDFVRSVNEKVFGITSHVVALASSK